MIRIQLSPAFRGNSGKIRKNLAKIDSKTTQTERIYYVFNFIVIVAHMHAHSPHFIMCVLVHIRQKPITRTYRGILIGKIHCESWTQIDTNRLSIEANATVAHVLRHLIGRGFGRKSLEDSERDRNAEQKRERHSSSPN